MFAYGNWHRYFCSPVKIVTIGYNPVPKDKNLGGCVSCSVYLKNACTKGEFTEKAVKHFVDKQSQYFENQNAQPYFDNIQKLLASSRTWYQDSESSKFKDHIAIHLDLIPFSTTKSFGELPKHVSEELLKKCIPLLQQKLESLKPHAIVTFVSETALQALFGTVHWTIEESVQKKRLHTLRVGNIQLDTFNTVVYACPPPQKKPLAQLTSIEILQWSLSMQNFVQEQYKSFQ